MGSSITHGIISDHPTGKRVHREDLKKHYNLIFLNHMMPEMDGVETFERMKEKSSPKYGYSRDHTRTAESGLGTDLTEQLHRGFLL